VEIPDQILPVTPAGPVPPAPPPRESPLRFIFFNERELRAGWRLLMYFALAFLIAAVLGWLLRRVSQGGPTVITAAIVILQDAILILMFVVPAVIMARYEQRTLADYGFPLRFALGRNFWMGVLWGIVALTVLLLALRINRSFVFGHVGLDWKEALWYGALWALAFYFVGVAEEFMLRGYTQFTLTTGIGFWPAAILLSLLFAALHLGNPGETPTGIGSVVAIGLFFAFTLWRTGSLWFAIGFHASWDWAQTFLFGVPNSGVIAKGHLLNPTIQGSSWYSGSTAGPEGSILIFPLIALMFVVFDRTFPKGARYRTAEARHATFLPQP
jgi:membrane protease YdiL (CAAX protease family)